MFLAALAHELAASDLPTLLGSGQREGPDSQVLARAAPNSNMHGMLALPPPSRLGPAAPGAFWPLLARVCSCSRRLSRWPA
eukprot:10879056-Alexandrium_andersonii.AAC.1